MAEYARGVQELLTVVHRGMECGAFDDAPNVKHDLNQALKDCPPKPDDKTIEEWLDTILVGEVDEDMCRSQPKNKGLRGLIGWYHISDDDGVFAYHNTEIGALRIRMAEINRRMNP